MSIENIIALLAALGIGSVLGFILNSRFEQQKQIKEHDMKIFKASNEILNEQQLSDIINYGLLSDLSIERENSARLRHWERYFSEVGNQYLEIRLSRAKKALLNDLAELTRFIGQHFFQIRGQDTSNHSIYLYPDLNKKLGFPSPEESVRFEKYANELMKICEKVQKQYAKYRVAIKQVLKI